MWQAVSLSGFIPVFSIMDLRAGASDVNRLFGLRSAIGAISQASQQAVRVGLSVTDPGALATRL